MRDSAPSSPVRVDGIVKVTGRALYAADLDRPDVTHLALITATIAHARIRHIDASRAAEPGVLAVLTHEDALTLGATTVKFLKFLQEPIVYFFGQPIAVVLADTPRAAQLAARAVRVSYDELPPTTTIAQARDTAYAPASAGRVATDSQRGDPEGAYADAEVTFDAEYRTATNNHHPIEPHCVTARWDGDQVTVYTSTAAVFATRRVIAESFGLPFEQVRVISEFVGGSFGAKGGAWFSCLTLAVAVARWAKRPVRLELSRAQMFTLVGRRQETVQRVRLGATRAGQLVSIRHDSVAQTSAFGEYADPVGTLARVLYACDNVAVTHRLVRTNAPQPNPMRAPGEGPGSFALETALDELAWILKMDPIELRLRNYADHDQHTGLPWSSNGLRECYRVAAAAFGWGRRISGTDSTGDRHLLIGSGMASACYPVYRMTSEAAVRINADGSLTVRCGTQDVGSGTYTVLAQLAADILGVPLRLVSVTLGDSALPEGPYSGGSMATASFTPAVEAAARLLRERIVTLATRDRGSPLFGVPASELLLHDGLVAHAGSGQRETLSDLVTRDSPEGLEERARTAPDDKPQHSGYSHGAVFAEVSVDPDLGVVRVRRITAAYASGRLLNPRLVRSQYIGGLIGGIGMALHEVTLTDERVGQIVNDNLSDYLVPVHADLPDFDIHLVPQHDPYLGGGIKGVGMIGTVGTAAAIANAVYHACGRRVRSLPIRLEHIL